MYVAFQYKLMENGLRRPGQHCDPLVGVLDYIAEVCLPDMTVRVYVLTRRQKKCTKGAIAEDIIAIAHDNDLHFIKDMVGPSQIAGIYTQIQLSMHLPRKRRQPMK